MTDITELAQSHELLIANGQQTADLLRHLADNEIDSDYFAVVSECESYGQETDAELSITEFALRAAGYVDELVEALELKEEQRANWFHMAQKLGNNLDAAEKRIAELEREPAARMVVTPTIWKHYTAAQTAIIYEKAMTDAGIKWRSIDERLTHEELESLYLAMKSHFEVMAESASEAEVIECSQIVRALCELQERRTAMLAVAPQEVK